MARKAKVSGEGEYPLHLYRDGTQMVWDGRQIDVLVVEDDEQESAALSDGWVRSFD